MKKFIPVFLSVTLIISLLSGCRKNYIDIMAVTGATPRALAEEAPSGIELKFDGMVVRSVDHGDVFERSSLIAQF